MNRTQTSLLLAAFLLDFTLSQSAPAADPVPVASTVLENDLVRVGLDDHGRLTELTNRQTGWDYAGKGGLWRVFYRQGDQFELEALAGNQLPKIVRGTSSTAVRYESLETLRHEPLAIAVEFRVGLQPGSAQTQWTIAVENRQSGITVTEVQFPLVGNCRLQSGQSLIWSLFAGQRFPDPKAAVRWRHSHYMAPDQNGIKMSAIYPGHASMNCFAFAGKEAGLYLGSHDPSLQNTLHLLRLQGEELEAGFVKYPFLKAGERFRSAAFVLAPYSGDWHTAARMYRKWADCWFVPPNQPDWVRKMTGWQRIILKHQYGEILHPYDTVGQMACDGLSAGINTMLIFGWWSGGMDGGYPDYDFDPALGGRDVFAAQIQEAHKQGAKVHIYFNGRLIDKESEFYRSGQASKMSIKDWRGNEVNESYHFSGNGTSVWQFGRKTFVMACPADVAWQKRRFGWIDQALALGADAVFFDQLGMQEMPCTDPTHGHPTPWHTCGQVRSENLKALREHVRSRNPQAAFGTEVVCDLAGSQADFLHGLTGGAGPHGFLEWFRYAFPEVVFSDREIRDDNDIERRVNLALIRGLRNDVELYRCRGTIADAPNYRKYLGQVNQLRTKYAEFFLEGTYRDTDGLQVHGGPVEAREFTSGDRMLVVLTQSARPEAAVKLAVPGYRLVSTDGLGDYRVDVHEQEKVLSVALKRHAVAVAVYQKQ